MQADSESGIRAAAVIGSVREGNFTSQAVRVIADEFAVSHPEAIVDPAHLNLSGPGLEEEGDAQIV